MNAARNKPEPFSWGHQRRFNDLSGYLTGKFGMRVQKLSIDAGFTCPNRDGSKGTGGCTFCNNQSFNPSYCSSELSVTEQLRKGADFFSGRYGKIKYLAYFQAYTNTYADFEHLIMLYSEALDFPGIAGLVIGTRPDCMTDELLRYLERLSTDFYVAVEYGVESTLDRTLYRINRGHTFADSKEAIVKTAGRGIHVGAHLILGLPGESRDEMLDHARKISQLPLNLVKAHQLQIVSGTAMADEYLKTPQNFPSFTIEEYIDLVIEFLELLNPEFVVERFANASPVEMIAGKRWGLRNYEIVTKIEKEMERRSTWQGRLFNCE